MSTATAGSSIRGNTEVSRLPCSMAVGANRPSMAIWFRRRSSSVAYMPPGGSMRSTPLDRKVRASSGRHWMVSVLVCPSGKVTVKVGA
ncbi:Uncharacterised protein [Mycobacteroides abscessus subsp. abscessus]|nr:Uncharacterised protein [Mycobacteroides abscessus subsp. abscessus]